MDAVAALLSDGLGITAFAAFTLLLPLLFPDGEVPGPRWRWVLHGAVTLTALSIFTALFAEGPMTVSVGETERVAVTDNPLGIRPFGLDLGSLDDVVSVVAAAWFAAGIAAIVVRFRRDPVARRQILWFAWGIVAAISMVMLTAVPALQRYADVLASLAFAWVPISIGIAITRYRLLLVAAVFRPVQRRVQSVVDRRFNRARYDAARTAADFGTRVRDEVELGALTEDLRRTASRALQPSSTTVWVRATT